jgi:hypothetical protein
MHYVYIRPSPLCPGDVGATPVPFQKSITEQVNSFKNKMDLSKLHGVVAYEALERRKAHKKKARWRRRTNQYQYTSDPNPDEYKIRMAQFRHC